MSLCAIKVLGMDKQAKKIAQKYLEFVNILGQERLLPRHAVRWTKSKVAIARFSHAP